MLYNAPTESRPCHQTRQAGCTEDRTGLAIELRLAGGRKAGQGRSKVTTITAPTSHAVVGNVPGPRPGVGQCYIHYRDQCQTDARVQRIPHHVGVCSSCLGSGCSEVRRHCGRDKQGRPPGILLSRSAQHCLSQSFRFPIDDHGGRESRGDQVDLANNAGAARAEAVRQSGETLAVAQCRRRPLVLEPPYRPNS